MVALVPTFEAPGVQVTAHLPVPASASTPGQNLREQLPCQLGSTQVVEAVRQWMANLHRRGHARHTVAQVPVLSRVQVMDAGGEPVLGSALYHALSHLNRGPHCIGLAPNHQDWPAVAATVVSTTLEEPNTRSQLVLIE